MKDKLMQDDDGNWYILTDSYSLDLLSDSDICYYIYDKEEEDNGSK